MTVVERAEALYLSWANDFLAAFKEEAPSWNEASAWARIHFCVVAACLTDCAVNKRVRDEAVCRELSLGALDPYRYQFHASLDCGSRISQPGMNYHTVDRADPTAPPAMHVLAMTGVSSKEEGK